MTREVRWLESIDRFPRAKCDLVGDGFPFVSFRREVLCQVSRSTDKVVWFDCRLGTANVVPQYWYESTLLVSLWSVADKPFEPFEGAGVLPARIPSLYPLVGRNTSTVWVVIGDVFCLCTGECEKAVMKGGVLRAHRCAKRATNTIDCRRLIYITKLTQGRIKRTTNPRYGVCDS